MSAATDALSCFVPLTHVDRVEPQQGTGWSGASIWKVQLVSGELLCLRRWPQSHPSPERLRLIHSVLTHAGRPGIDFLPIPRPSAGGDTFVAVDGGLWEVTRWLPGTADFRSLPSRERLAAALTALARFHVVTADFTPAFGPAPAFVERLGTAKGWLAGLFVRLAEAAHRSGFSLRGEDRLRPGANSILHFAGAALPRLVDRLARAAEEPLRLQPAIRDLHHEHVLFKGSEVSGLVDFGALRIDTPLTDIARLVGSLVGDNREDWDHALCAYDQHRQLETEDRERIRLLDESGTVLGGLQWLRWLWLEGRDMGDLERIAIRLEELAARLRVLHGS
jgi:Ser/Thr protein kinase RdoA (MazF antagonist)